MLVVDFCLKIVANFVRTKVVPRKFLFSEKIFRLSVCHVPAYAHVPLGSRVSAAAASGPF